MKHRCKGFAERFLILITFMVFGAACSTTALRASRRGLLENNDARSSSQASVNRKTASDIFSPKSGGEVQLSGQWQWPLQHVEISSSYGQRGRKFHQGVDLRAHVGTEVHAAAAGDVVYVGSKIRGYGRMVVLKHAGGYYTVYAHHSKNLVKVGERVKQGEVIALSGKSGHSHGAHLHFELRRGTQSYDPEYAFNGYLKSSANRKIASKSHLSHQFED